MAEESGQDRTEEPTPKRLSEARQKGQVARSKELGTTTMLLGSAIGLLIFGQIIINGLFDVMRNSFSVQKEHMFDPIYMILMFKDAVAQALISISPLMLVLVISAVVGSTALSGWNFSVQALAVKFSKMNPLSGMKRIVGPQGLMELGKALAKFFVIAGTGILVLYGLSDRVMGLGLEPIEQAIAHSGEIILWAFLIISLSMILISAFDVPFQLWNHKRQLKMTKQEVKQENKDTDGSPEVKQRIRRAQMEIAMRRMMQEIPDADVVITNPTHYAVAVKYDQKKMRAPIVVAKGSDLVAAEIRRIAMESNVPIMSAPPLARAIYFTTELNKEVPEGLYLAVAQVLAYIYHLKRSSGFYGDLEMKDLPIPEDLNFDSKGKPGV